MKHLINEILNIMSYNDKDEDQKIEEIKNLCIDEAENYENLLDLKEWVTADIIAGNFDINQDGIYTNGYEKACNLVKTVKYEFGEDI